MDGSDTRIIRYERGRLTTKAGAVVREFPLQLQVNGRQIATLIASPHQLNFLVAGFLRLQGFIRDLSEIEMMGICEDFGAARVSISGSVPEKLSPVLTSGCGTGITFESPTKNAERSPKTDNARFSPDVVFGLMKDLFEKAENYRRHGGIHSAAVGDGDRLLLYAEDIGRHNTLDRIAGEALFRRVDLEGRMLVTSGRISTEMVAKAARLGIVLIASRTSPTDMAVRMAEEAGITLIGYLRGESCEIYTCPQRFAAPVREPGVAGVSGVILAGGESRRMGSDKSLLPIGGARFIDHVYRTMSALFEEVLIVTNSPTLYDGIPCRKVPDIYHAQGSLAGIHSGLCHARNERTFVVACDMPLVNSEVVRHICTRADGWDVVIPRGENGREPLHALYGKKCLDAMEAVLETGRKRIVGFFPKVRVSEVPMENLLELDPKNLSFRNINTPEEYFLLRDGDREGQKGGKVPKEKNRSSR